MSMRVNENTYVSESRRPDKGSAAQEAAKEKGAEKAQKAAEQKSAIPTPKDEYVSSEKSGQKPAGLYWLGRDENGRPKVFCDQPKKTDSGAREPAVSPESRSEECTTNTDKVDQEIKKLKEEKRQLEQQLKAANGDAEKTRELEKKLALIENELIQKDNDTYRRQNAMIL